MAVEGRAGSGLACQVLWTVEDLDSGIVVARFRQNLVLTVGLTELVRLFTGASGATPFGQGSRIGVGDSSTAPDPGQTGLLGSNTFFKSMNPGFPQVAPDGLTVTYQSTFGPTEANFNWQEFALDNGAGVTFNRRVQPVGTKSGGSWRVSLIVRFAAAG